MTDEQILIKLLRTASAEPTRFRKAPTGKATLRESLVVWREYLHEHQRRPEALYRELCEHLDKEAVVTHG